MTLRSTRGTTEMLSNFYFFIIYCGASKGSRWTDEMWEMWWDVWWGLRARAVGMLRLPDEGCAMWWDVWWRWMPRAEGVLKATPPQGRSRGEGSIKAEPRGARARCNLGIRWGVQWYTQRTTDAPPKDTHDSVNICRYLSLWLLLLLLKFSTQSWGRWWFGCWWCWGWWGNVAIIEDAIRSWAEEEESAVGDEAERNLGGIEKKNEMKRTDSHGRKSEEKGKKN